MDESPTTMNVSLPRPLREFVRDRMARTGFGNASEYIRHLIRLDQKRAAEESLEMQILDGLRSGEAAPGNAGYWDAKRRDLGRPPSTAERAD